MSIGNNKELYLLRQELRYHEKGVRSLCVLSGGKDDDEVFVTGGYDGIVIVWRQLDTPSDISQEEEQTASPSSASASSATVPPPQYQPDVLFSEHTESVTCICEGPLDKDGIPTFFSGGQDKNIFWVNTQGKKLRTITGHGGLVNSITLSRVNHKSVLASGSWDATAKIWDIETGACLHTLSGHKYAVSVFSWSCPDRSSDVLITGSQDGNLHVWDFSFNQLRSPVKSMTAYHTDIIRGFSRIFQFSHTTSTTPSFSSILLSCSNDGCIRATEFSVRNEALTVEPIRTVPVGDTFVFDIAVLEKISSHELFVFAACEDGKLRILDWNTFQTVQDIQHVGTVWKIALLSNGDLLSGCADGSLRIWTRDDKRALPYEQREQLKNDVSQAILAAEERAPPSIDVANLPDVSQLSGIKGNKAGQHRLFRDGDKAFVYVWNGHTWEYVDQAVSKSPGSIMGKFFKGDDYFAPGEYDYLFDAEIADDGIKRIIPFRVGDNTLLVAQKFCARERISNSHIPEIERFIKQNVTIVVPSHQGPRLPSSTAAASSAAAACHVKLLAPVKSRHFPASNYVAFTSYQADKLKEKLLEFDKAQPGESRKLTELEKSYLDELIVKLNQPRLVNENFRHCEIDLVFNSHLGSWPAPQMFAVIDLWRIMALHPQSTDVFKRSDGGWHYIALALRLAKDTSPDCSPHLAMCCMRYLCNLFIYPTTRSSLLKYEPQIIGSLPGFPVTAVRRQTRRAEASVFVNLCIALGESTLPISLETAENILRSIIQRLQHETDEGVRYSLLVAIGTLTTHLSDPVRVAVSELCQMLKLQLKDETTVAEELKSCQDDVAAILSKT